MQVAGLVQELTTLRRILERTPTPDPALVSRHGVLREALILGQCLVVRTDAGGRAVRVRLHQGAGVVELGALLATDREIVLALDDALPTGEERVLLLSIGESAALAVRSRVLRSEPGLCRFDVTELSRADRLCLLEAVAIDVARSGLGPLRAPSPKMPVEDPAFEFVCGGFVAPLPSLDAEEEESGSDRPTRHAS